VSKLICLFERFKRRYEWYCVFDKEEVISSISCYCYATFARQLGKMIENKFDYRLAKK